MCLMFKCLCILYLNLLIITNAVKFRNVIESRHNLAFGEPLAVQSDNNIKAGEIFGTFLRNLFDLLINGFPGRKVIRFCRDLNRHLRTMEFTYTKKLAKHMRYLSRMYRDDIKAEIKEYRRELDENRPMRKQFLEAMNEVFTIKENLLFNDFIFDLRDYGNEDKPSITEETSKLLNMIVESIYKLSIRDRMELERKLRKAIKEYQII